MRLKKNITHHRYFRFVRVLLASLIVSITVYTLVIFYDLLQKAQVELFFYLIPSFILTALFFLMYKRELLSGILFLFISFGFLLIYQVSIAFTVFSFLIFIGTLLLLDDHFTHTYTKKNVRDIYG